MNTGIFLYAPPFGPTARGWCALALILAISLTTSACGFRLRGVTEIPPEFSPIFIHSPPGSLVRSELVRQLRESQVPLTTKPSQARTRIRIRNERRSFHVTAVDSNGKVLAQELHYGLTFEALAADKKQLVPRQSFDLRRSHENPTVAILGKQQEAQLIYAEMFRDAAGRILERLRAALPRSQEAGNKKPRPAKPLSLIHI